MQQREGKGIFVDEGVEGQPAIKTHDALVADTEGLRIDDACLRVDLIIDAGERRPEFADKHVQRFCADRRDAKGNVIWQGERVEHLGIAGLSSHHERP